MIKSFGGIVISFFILSSCIYDPHGDSFKEIIQKEPTPLSLNFFSNQDTVLLRGALNLGFEFPANKDLVYYKLYLDDILIREDKCCPYSVYLDSRNYANGFHNLKLELYQKTNSNSLADKLDAEAFVFSYVKPAFIDNTQLTSDAIKISDIGIEDSLLYIEWTPYTGRGFKSYRISDRYSSINEVIIIDQNLNRLNIDQYTGGLIELQVYLEVYDQEVVVSKIYNYDIKFKLTQFKPKSDKFNMTWDPSPFRKWNGLTIKILDTYSYNTFDYKINRKATSFDVVSPFPFPFEITVDVRTNENETLIYYELLSSSLTTQINSGLVDNIDILTDSTFKMMQVVNPFNKAEKDIISLNSFNEPNSYQSHSGYLALSPNGKKLFEFNNGFIIKLDPITFQPIDQFSILDKIEAVNKFITFESSNEEFIFLMAEFYNYNKFYVWNWNSKTIIYEGYMPYINYTKSVELSPDGTRLFDHSFNYTYDLTLADPFAKRQGTGSQTRYISQTKDEIFYSAGNLVQRNAYPPYSVIKEKPYDKTVSQVISNQNGEFGVLYKGVEYLRIDFHRLETFEYLGTIELSNQLLINAENLFLSMTDNYLILTNQKLYIIPLPF
jgi:hypothetical protein